jgi:hypothetical protein
MSLLIICDQTELYINFYVVFCFMIKKKMNDYRWALKQLKVLYARLKILNFIVFVIDMKKRLMIARYLIFSNFNHLLCIWHINNNVLIKCRKSFVIKENWDEFFQKWKNVMYVSTKSEFRKIWNAFSNKYNLSHEDCVKYLIDIYIRDHRRRFVKTYINQVLHFETTMSSRSEIEHSQLKRHLRASTDDLKSMIDSINLMLKNQIHNHQIAWNENKIRFSTECRKLIFQQLTAFVTFYVIRQMMSQYQLLTKRSIALFLCIDIFVIIMSLSCSHKMQKRLYQKESLLIEDVYSHWR